MCPGDGWWGGVPHRLQSSLGGGGGLSGGGVPVDARVEAGRGAEGPG